MKCQKCGDVIAAILLLASLLMFSGCRLSYLLHAAAGEYQLLNHAVPLDVAL
jgi:hypothetical protein